jgi:hypothetical protein
MRNAAINRPGDCPHCHEAFETHGYGFNRKPDVSPQWFYRCANGSLSDIDGPASPVIPLRIDGGGNGVR